MDDINSSPLLRSRLLSRSQSEGDEKPENENLDGVASSSSASQYMIIPTVISRISSSSSSSSALPDISNSKHFSQKLAASFPPLPEYSTHLSISARAKLHIGQVIAHILSSLLLLILVILSWLSLIPSKFNNEFTGRAENSNKFKDDFKHNSIDDQFEKVQRCVNYYSRRAGYDCETFTVMTQDHFILTLHHVIKAGCSLEDRHPVLLMHGLFQSSGVFVLNEENSLAFALFDAGYDVWMGNNRCAFSNQHARLGTDDPNRWNWTIKDLALYDIPALIDFILEHTKSSTLAYVGHSQGNAQCFTALALNPELGRKLSSFTALAPTMFPGPLLTSFPFKYLQSLSPSTFMTIFGQLAFCPQMCLTRPYVPAKVHAAFAYRMFAWLFNWHDHTWVKRRKPKYFQFMPEPVSARSLEWWLTTFVKNGGLFPLPSTAGLRETLGSNIDESKSTKFEADRPRRWFEKKSFPPLCLLFSEGDNLVANQMIVEEHFRDVEGFTYGCSRGQMVHSDTLENYLHMDVVWASDVSFRVVKVIDNVIRKTI